MIENGPAWRFPRAQLRCAVQAPQHDARHRSQVVDHDPRAATGLEHTVDLVNGLSRVRRVVQDAVRVDDVEGGIREREVLGISHDNFSPQVFEN